MRARHAKTMSRSLPSDGPTQRLQRILRRSWPGGLQLPALAVADARQQQALEHASGLESLTRIDGQDAADRVVSDGGVGEGALALRCARVAQLHASLEGRAVHGSGELDRKH